MEELYLCADVGGTQIKTGLLTAAGELVGDIHRADAQANLPRVPLLDHMAHCLLTTAQTAQTVRGIRIAMPGPFDYGAGICKMEGLEKYGALYNVNVREELEHRLRPVLGQAAADVRMQNDVASFALGELHFGRAQGAARGGFSLYWHRMRQRVYHRQLFGTRGNTRHAGERLCVPLAPARKTDGRLDFPPRPAGT